MSGVDEAALAEQWQSLVNCERRTGPPAKFRRATPEQIRAGVCLIRRGVVRGEAKVEPRGEPKPKAEPKPMVKSAYLARQIAARNRRAEQWMPHIPQGDFRLGEYANNSGISQNCAFERMKALISDGLVVVVSEGLNGARIKTYRRVHPANSRAAPQHPVADDAQPTRAG